LWAGIFWQEYLLTRPVWLATFLWQLSARNRPYKDQVRQGFNAHAKGDLQAVRRDFLTAIYHNPVLLFNRRIVSRLIESLVGSERIHQFRTLREQLRNLVKASD
jgi:hypothetical protein